MKRQGVIVIVNAMIWAFTMLMISHTLKGTGAYQEIQLFLSLGAAASLLVVGSGVIKKKSSSV